MLGLWSEQTELTTSLKPQGNHEWFSSIAFWFYLHLSKSIFSHHFHVEPSNHLPPSPQQNPLTTGKLFLDYSIFFFACFWSPIFWLFCTVCLISISGLLPWLYLSVFPNPVRESHCLLNQMQSSNNSLASFPSHSLLLLPALIEL